MKVMFVVHRMHPNLTEVHQALISFGHQCVFIVAGVGPSEPDVFEDRILVYPSVLSDAAVSEIFDHHQPDLVVQRNIDGPYVLFWKIARKRGICQVLYTQDPHEVPFVDTFVRPLRVVRLCRDLLMQRFSLGPHARITPVKFWGRSGSVAFSDSKYVPFPSVPREPTQLASPRTLTVTTVAKHGQRRKRVRWLIRALKESKKPFRLVLVGARPGETEIFRKLNHARVLRLIQDLGARAENVAIHENLDREEIEALYKASDIFALPAKRELMAISPLEAMSHGLPVLVSSDGGATSYVRPAGTEQIFRARSYRDFRKKLYHLIQDCSLRASLGNRALDQIRLEHSPGDFVARLEKLAGFVSK